MSIVIKKVPLLTVWHMRKEVMYPQMTIAEMKLEDDDEKGEHLGLYDGDALCSVVSLFINNNALQFRKFATATALQGKGYGTQLLQHVFEKAKEDRRTIVWCNARITAMPFYQKFGMEAFEESWEQHGHWFIKMRITVSP